MKRLKRLRFCVRKRKAYKQRLKSLILTLKKAIDYIKAIVEIVKDEEVKLNRLDVELENRLDTLTGGYTS